MLRLRSIQVHQVLLERVDGLLRLRLETRVWPLLLIQTVVVVLLKQYVVLLVLRQICGLHVRGRIRRAASLLRLADLLVLFDVEVADEVHLVLRQLLGAKTVRGANCGMLVDFVGAADGLQLGLGYLTLTHVRRLRFLYLTLVGDGARHAFDLMEGVLEVLFALRVHVIAKLSEMVLLHSLIVDLHKGVPLHLLRALVRGGVLLDDDRAVRGLPVVIAALLHCWLVGVEPAEDVCILVLGDGLRVPSAAGQLARRVRRHNLRHVVQASLLDDERCIIAVGAHRAVGSGDDAGVMEGRVTVAGIAVWTGSLVGRHLSCSEAVLEGTLSPWPRHHRDLAGIHWVMTCISIILLLLTFVADHQIS